MLDRLSTSFQTYSLSVIAAPAVRPASRSAYRQTSTLSVPESVYEDEEFEEYVEEESGVYSRGTSRPTTRQPSRVTIRPQVSTRSVAESNYSDRPPLKSALRQQVRYALCHTERQSRV